MFVEVEVLNVGSDGKIISTLVKVLVQQFMIQLQVKIINFKTCRGQKFYP